MFQELRLKLTLINATILFLLFLLLIVGSYLLSQADMTSRADFMEQRIVEDIRAGVIDDLPLTPHGSGLAGGYLPKPFFGTPGADVIFVKTSPSGAIVSQSSYQPIDVTQLAELVDRVLRAREPRGTVHYAQTSFVYLKAPLDNQTGSLILFHDLSRERDLLGIWLTILASVGMICLVLSFGASFYLANRAMVPIKKAWQQQKDFLADASHELRTPLTVIRINLEVVMDSPEETVASQRKWLENIQEETSSMARLIESLLFLARVDSQQQLLEKRLFFLDETVQQAVGLFEPVATAKGVFLEMDLPVVTVQYYGDAARFKQLISILLDNAIRHTPAGGKVTVSLSQADMKILLSVVDTGEGIEPEHLEKIFDRFYQVSKSRNKGGSGLGLAIAKWIAESHNGVIAVASRPGEGTAFTLTFPAGK